MIGGVKILGRLGRVVIGNIVLGVLLLGAGRDVNADDAPPPRNVHRFLQIAVSPDGALVASVEGDSPPGDTIRRCAN